MTFVSLLPGSDGLIQHRGVMVHAWLTMIMRGKFDLQNYRPHLWVVPDPLSLPFSRTFARDSRIVSGWSHLWWRKEGEI